MNVEITELTGKTLENLVKEFSKRCIMECGKLYGFSGETAIKELQLENIKLNRKAMNRKSVTEKKVKVKEFQFPFVASQVNKLGCKGLAYNKGLFTQCDKKVLENNIYCNKCNKEASESTMGIPLCGTVEQRLACGLYEFKDTKGRSPISYLKLLKKEKLGEVEAKYEASKLNFEIPAEHFEEIVKAKKVKEEDNSTDKKSKGRPKKEKTVIEAKDVNDLFSQITSDKDVDVAIEKDNESPKKKAPRKLSDEEKEEKKAKLEAEKAEKKAKLEAEKEAKKLALEKEKAEKKLALEKEKEAKKLALEKEKAEKKAKLEAEKQEKQEKSKKKVEEKVEEKVEQKVEKVEQKVEQKVVEKVEQKVEQNNKKKVTRITIDGKQYLKTAENVIYDPETREELGTYDPVNNKIIPLPEDDEEEEEEEEYDL